MRNREDAVAGFGQLTSSGLSTDGSLKAIGSTHEITLLLSASDFASK